jgi:hypothetical protein
MYKYTYICTDLNKCKHTEMIPLNFFFRLVYPRLYGRLGYAGGITRPSSRYV